MEKLLLNPYDKECMRKAMLRHEQTFRDQVNELHRLYRTQKILMKDLATSHPSRPNDHSRALEFVEPENIAGEYSGVEDDQSSDLELTLGPRSYCQKNIKAAEPGTDLSGFSSTSCMKRSTSTKEGKFQSQELDNSHWVFQVLSLNMTS
ncbi:uncharacterized protein [Henckelia pumila]|uniref:uncharacterized protein n=1 Tax=Henckelia pumila TaxID=405737 RepID=UPI003C6E8C5F